MWKAKFEFKILELLDILYLNMILQRAQVPGP